MKHTDFEESNKVYRGTLEGSSELHVYEDRDERGYNFIISSWDSTPEEMLNFLLFGRVWIHIWSEQQPHIYLGTTSPFVHSKKRIELEEKERVDQFKNRLVRAFLSEKGIRADLDLPTPMEFTDLENLMNEFMDYLISRGEK